VIKKLFVTFLAVLYFGVSSGATLHYQYCMGKLMKVSLWHDEAGNCHTCGMPLMEKAAKKCCTDKHQHLKSEKSSSVTYTQVALGTSAMVLPVILSYGWLSYHQQSLTVEYPVGIAPPAVTTVPVFLRHCTFRI